MEQPTMIEAARTALGHAGAKIPQFGLSHTPPTGVLRAAAREFENAGYKAAWNGEGVGGRDAFTELAVLLAATERLVVGTSVANMFARPGQTTHGAAAMLQDAYSGRFVLGLGLGYPFQAEQVGQSYAKPLKRTRDYFAQMDAETSPLQRPVREYPRLLAALGPKMLELAGEISDGILPAMVPPAYCEHARSVLGPDKLIAVTLPIVYDDDVARARETARAIVQGTLTFPDSPYRTALGHLGYTDTEMDGADDRIVDAIVGHGARDDIAAKVAEHLESGADHVIIMPTVADFDEATRQLTHLAPAVLAAEVDKR